MTQETRKDRRVKVVSLNVRYRSATLEEFIENHAHDVSRGGLFIKTANPFPPGTLLKFEIRLANDQAVIAGVGRVAWKREEGPSGGGAPPGMGIKFIKVDEASKAIVDRLVAARPDGESGADPTEEPNPGDVILAAQHGSDSGSPRAMATPVPRPMSVPPRNATRLGLGGVAAASPSTSYPPQRPSLPSRAPVRSISDAASGSPAEAMFPKSEASEDSGLSGEATTVMKQASELLEEALRAAGGSLAEVGSNPLFVAQDASVAEVGRTASDAPSPTAKPVGPALEPSKSGKPSIPAESTSGKPSIPAESKSGKPSIPAESKSKDRRASPSNKPTSATPSRRSSVRAGSKTPEKSSETRLLRGRIVRIAATAVCAVGVVGVSIWVRHYQPREDTRPGGGAQVPTEIRAAAVAAPQQSIAPAPSAPEPVASAATAPTVSSSPTALEATIAMPAPSAPVPVRAPAGAQASDTPADSASDSAPKRPIVAPRPRPPAASPPSPPPAARKPAKPSDDNPY